MKRSNKVMMILKILLVVFFIVVVFFNVPYSKIKADFQRDSNTLMSQTMATTDIFTEEDIKDLPVPVQKYFTACGYIGTKKMSSMKATFKDVPFKTGRDKPTLKIDYTQYNFVNQPDRIALIDSSMFGIPFQGYDSYINGTGSMKGVIAKVYTLFDQRGDTMDKASLVTYLAESLLIPSAALQDFIVWESIDDTHVKATISYYGISASGIFTFNESGEMASFTTEDRVATETDGSTQNVSWTAICSDYKEVDGIKIPTVLQAIWHYDEGDLIYFDSDHFVIEYL
ncbi:MAG: hypothetical protein NUK65_05835 [Firmicutes bacterium]|nr:hypothetical protein [Bacillota bacterium]